MLLGRETRPWQDDPFDMHEEDGITLYRFTPRVAKPRPVPLLISYALVNRPYMVDLQEDRSMVRIREGGLSAAGLAGPPGSAAGAEGTVGFAIDATCRP